MTIRNLSTAAATFVAVIAILSIAAGPVAGGAGQAALQQQDGAAPGNYSVLQDGDCTTISTFGDGSQSVEEFYDYRTPETEPSSYTYSSLGTMDLQRDDTSILFLYEGTEGTSLVLVHDRVYGGTNGSAVTMQFDSLPEEGEWAVEDDSYSDDLSGGPSDEFDHGETSSRITWVYSENSTDGAVFRGGLDDNDVDITIDPAFNDNADFRVYPGEITDWQALSSGGDGTERTSLDFRPIELRSGPCSSFDVSDVTAPSDVEADESFEIGATVENDGNVEDTFTVPIAIDGDVVDETDVTLDAGAETEVTTTVTLNETGTHAIEVGDEAVEVTVTEASNETTGETDTDQDGNDAQLPGFGVAAAIGSLLGAAIVARRRRV
ncbi:CARDB domain-containing protein [Natronoarchaeum mannanilyticum]|uniref:CARDB domain-containing protein n=1 Tax=Natronoarchaeum mannanilyticum TaxID=926360 RepID=A0AAV3TBZ0_9EURY